MFFFIHINSSMILYVNVQLVRTNFPLCLGINVRRTLASEHAKELNWINFPSASQPCYNVNYANFTIFVCLFLKIVHGVSSQFHDFPPHLRSPLQVLSFGSRSGTAALLCQRAGEESEAPRFPAPDRCLGYSERRGSTHVPCALCQWRAVQTQR